VILRAMTSGEPDSDPSVAMSSAQHNSDVLAAAIDKPIEVVVAEG
jgi:hypothetical protein